jgi:hypothetical protein
VRKICHSRRIAALQNSPILNAIVISLSHLQPPRLKQRSPHPVRRTRYRGREAPQGLSPKARKHFLAAIAFSAAFGV